MSLQDRLDRISESFAEKADPEVLEAMKSATEELAASGQAERAVGAGQEAPGFRLEGSDGDVVELAERRARGPVILTFFRGHW